MYALSFGPLSKNDLAQALKQVGMTMRDGSAITIQKLAACIQRLRDRGIRSSPWGRSRRPARPRSARPRSKRPARRAGCTGSPWRCSGPCPARSARIPGSTSGEGRRFVSFFHACRDVFLALEQDDQDELKRLAGLCSQDEQIRFPRSTCCSSSAWTRSSRPTWSG